jgi:hypothetical protein
MTQKHTLTRMHKRERIFAKNFFDHTNWRYTPKRFDLGGVAYVPDFYDGARDMYIEVAGTRQAYAANKHKYAKMAEMYPDIKLEVRLTSGAVLTHKNERCKWKDYSIADLRECAIATLVLRSSTAHKLSLLHWISFLSGRNLSRL